MVKQITVCHFSDCMYFFNVNDFLSKINLIVIKCNLLKSNNQLYPFFSAVTAGFTNGYEIEKKIYNRYFI